MDAEQGFSIQSLVAATLQKQHDAEAKPPTGYWRSSSLGSCLCGAYLARQGKAADEPFDDRTLRVFSLGHFAEDWLLDLVSRSLPAGYAMDRQLEYKSRDGTLVGHYDARVTTAEGVPLVYELKSCHSRKFWYMVNQGRGADVHHKMQLWSYLWMSGVAEGRIVYVSKDDLCLQEYPVFWSDEGLRKLVEDELATLNQAWALQVAPDPVLDPKDWRYRYCRYHRQCTAIAAERGLKFTPKDDKPKQVEPSADKKVTGKET
jgi:hypothetical protein